MDYCCPCLLPWPPRTLGQVPGPLQGPSVCLGRHGGRRGSVAPALRPGLEQGVLN